MGFRYTRRMVGAPPHEVMVFIAERLPERKRPGLGAFTPPE
jgi:hypothetical protein